ncbi:MAG: hypothetical protein JOS17DRAFT_269871 [Linnemannia elongata]|nr:MAG: hypothetical protein JOS17DRAFT_269871 [Linnemannia elongata]
MKRSTRQPFHRQSRGEILTATSTNPFFVCLSLSRPFFIFLFFYFFIFLFFYFFIFLFFYFFIFLFFYFFIFLFFYFFIFLFFYFFIFLFFYFFIFLFFYFFIFYFYSLCTPHRHREVEVTVPSKTCFAQISCFLHNYKKPASSLSTIPP